MDWLKELRMALNLTQEQVAKKANMARATYSNIEIGKRTPSVPMAKKIAGAMGFEWTRFFEEG